MFGLTMTNGSTPRSTSFSAVAEDDRMRDIAMVRLVELAQPTGASQPLDMERRIGESGTPVSTTMSSDLEQPLARGMARRACLTSAAVTSRRRRAHARALLRRARHQGITALTPECENRIIVSAGVELMEIA